MERCWDGSLHWFTMNSAAYLSSLKEEIARLQQIQSLLENESADVTSRSSVNTPASKRTGGMTDAGRARVAEAQRLRWAAKKKADAEAAATPDPKAAKKKAQAPAKKATAKKSSAAAKPVATGRSAPAKKNTAAKAAPRKPANDATKLPVANRGSETSTVEPPTPETATPTTPAEARSNE